MNTSLEKLAVLFIAMILALAPMSGMLAEDYTAQTMRLLRYEGEVEIQDSNGKSRFVMENVRFKSGEAMLTGANSLASVGLDDTKIVSLDENTRVEFFKDGSQMRLKLTEGTILLDVREKLDENESLDVEISNLTVGIRGTVVKFKIKGTIDGIPYIMIAVLEGELYVKYTDEGGKLRRIKVSAGYAQIALDLDKDGNCDYVEIRRIEDADLEGFVEKLMEKDPELKKRIMANRGQPVGSPMIPPHTHTGGTATCTEAAICAACGQPYGEPLGHVEEAVPAVAATCTEAGLTAGSKCARCGEILTAQQEIPALGHEPETIPAVPAACTEPGLSEGVKCARCGEVLTAQQEIPALGHEPETIPAVPATCTEPGLSEGVKCARCGEILTAQQEIPALGHEPETIPAVPATCTEAGHTEGVKCARCGDILTAQEENPALGHEPETIPATAPTCTEAGLSEGVKCARCGEILTAQEEIPALGHEPETIPATATCTEPGLTEGVRCARCGEILTAQEEIPALGHQPEPIPGKAATCTEPGLTEGVRCARCGKILTAQQVIPALGHDWGEWTDVEIKDGKTLQRRVCKHDETHVNWQEVALGNKEKLPVGTKVTIDNATYEVTKDGVTLISFDPGSATSISVPKYVRINRVDYSVTAIGSNAFEKCGNVTEITLKLSPCRIAAGAFTGCNKLNTLNITEKMSLTVDKDAFKGVPSKILQKLKVHLSKDRMAYVNAIKYLLEAGILSKNISKDIM